LVLFKTKFKSELILAMPLLCIFKQIHISQNGSAQGILKFYHLVVPIGFV